MIEPIFHILERFSIINGIHDNNSRCGSIISFSHGPKPFLACGVPQLEFDEFGNIFIIAGLNAYDFRFEVNSNGWSMRHGIVQSNKSHEDIGLTDRRVSNYNYFSEIIMGLLLIFG